MHNILLVRAIKCAAPRRHARPIAPMVLGLFFGSGAAPDKEEMRLESESLIPRSGAEAARNDCADDHLKAQVAEPMLHAQAAQCVGSATAKAGTGSALLGEETMDKPVRCLMLHGRAADEFMLQTALRAGKWNKTFASHIEFVCVRAMHPCTPWTGAGSPYTNFEAMGLYPPKGGTFDNGLIFPEPHTAPRLLETVEMVEARLRDDPRGFEAIGGICEGALAAALVASRQPAGIRFFLNICGSPIELLPAALRPRVHISVPSLHVIGTADELYSQEQLRSLPSRCNPDDARVVVHEGGHAVPMATPHLTRAIIGHLEHTFGTPRAGTHAIAGHITGTSRMSVDDSGSSQSGEDESGEEGSDGEGGSGGALFGGGGTEGRVDSLQLLLLKGKGLPEMHILTFNTYALLTVRRACRVH